MIIKVPGYPLHTFLEYAAHFPENGLTEDPNFIQHPQCSVDRVSWSY